MQEVKTCTTCDKNLNCQTQLNNYPCFGCSDWQKITVKSCPRSYSNEHVYNGSEYEHGFLTCELCGFRTTVIEVRQFRKEVSY